MTASQRARRRARFDQMKSNWVESTNRNRKMGWLFPNFYLHTHYMKWKSDDFLLSNSSLPWVSNYFPPHPVWHVQQILLNHGVGLPWVSNYFLPVVSGRFVGHVPQCIKFTFAKIFVGQVKLRGSKLFWKPTVKVRLGVQHAFRCFEVKQTFLFGGGGVKNSIKESRI